VDDFVGLFSKRCMSLIKKILKVTGLFLKKTHEVVYVDRALFSVYRAIFYIPNLNQVGLF